MGPISLRKGVVDELAVDLVESLTHLHRESDDGQVAIDFAISNFRFHKFLDVNSFDVDRKISGLSEKFQVHSDPRKAEHLDVLTAEFLGLPLASTSDRKDQSTDSHYSLLSLLLLLSDAPLNKDYVAPDEKIVDADDVIDWKSFLLDDCEELSLGIPLDSQLESLLDDSDLALSETDDEEESITDDVQTELQQEAEPLVTDRSLELQPAKTSSAENDKMAKSSAWLKRNVSPSYWLAENASWLDLHDNSYHVGQSSVAHNWELFQSSPDGGPYLHHAVPKQVVPELRIVRESLWLLQGSNNSGVLYQWIDGICTPRSNVTCLHLSASMLSAVLRQFASVGTMMYDLGCFTKDCSDLKAPYSKTFRAFSSSIANHLKAIRTKLCSIDKSVIAKEETVTLAKLLHRLREQFAFIRSIHSLYEQGVRHNARSQSAAERVAFFLDCFYDLLLVTDNLADTGVPLMPQLVSMFVATIVPYLEQLDAWMSSGELRKGDDEFFIARCDGIDKNTIRYWKDTFNIKAGKTEEMLCAVPRFLRHHSNEVLLAGKALNLLQDFGKFSRDCELTDKLVVELKANLHKTCGYCPEEDQWRDWETASMVGSIDLLVYEKSVLLKQNFDRLFCQHSATSNDARQDGISNRGWCYDCHLPFELILRETLNPLIKRKYHKGCELLMRLFKEEFHLFQHLRVMKDFFLMAAGDTLALFYSELFEKISRQSHWHDLSYLNIVLHDALMLQHPHLIDRLTVVLITDHQQSANAESARLAFDAIRLHYEIPYPVAVLLDNDVERQYNVIFRFLLHLKHALWSVERVSFSALDDNDRRADAAATRPAVKQRLYVFRMRLLHFIQNLHIYVMTRILHSTRLEFETQLNKLTDIDDVIALHKDFLCKLLDRCLLNDKVGLVQEAISRILDIASSFGAMWNLGIEHVDEDDVMKLEAEYQKCLQFVLSFLRNLSKRGSFPHLELLATSLMI